MKRYGILLLALVALAALPAGAGRLIVANANDSTVWAYDLPTGNVVGSQHMGGQALGVAAVGGKIAVTDFLGGGVTIYTAQRIGDYLGVGRQSVSTAPDLVNPEGITPVGKNGWALVSDGVTQVEGQSVGLTLVDLFAAKKLSSVIMPSVYGVAFDPQTFTAYALDGFTPSIWVVKLSAAGQLTDTGVRLPVSGAGMAARYIALDAAGRRLLVSYKLAGAVEAIDLATGQSLGLVSGLGTAIGAIALTPDGTRAFVADWGTSQWAVLDLSAPGLPVDTGRRIACAYGVPNTYAGTRTFAFAGDVMYFSASNSNVISGLDWKAETPVRVEWATGLSPAGMDVSN